jgi:TRAP-type uncharacterized transport system fused permease subunit
MAPFYATALLLAAAMLRKETRFNLKRFFEFVAGAGKMMVELTTVLTAIGFVVGALTVTGIAFAFSRELVYYAHGSVPLILIFGAFTSFVMGMGMIMTATYIILAIVVAPALVQMGLNVFAVHLFIMYWGLVSFITPPVAVAAYTAATLAGTDGLSTGVQAMKLGFVKYVIPFFFVYNPALVFQGTLPEVLFAFSTCFLGVVLISCALEGYALGFGKIGVFGRIMTTAAGVGSAVSSAVIIKFLS